MTPRAAARVAWSLWLITAALVVITLFLTPELSGAEVYFLFFFPVFMAAFATVGALIASRHPANAIGWIFLATALIWAVASAATSVAEYAKAGRIEVTSWVLLADWLGAWSFLPGIYAPVTFLFLLFPDGRLPSRRWRLVAWAAAAGALLITVSSALRAGPLPDAVILRSNPYSLGPRALWEFIESAAWFLSFGGVAASVVALIGRLRRSSGTERQQMKWLAYAGVLVIATFFATGIAWAVLGDDADPTIRTVVLPAVILFALALVPVAAGVAILRHRLYDIDVVIKKTVVFGILAVVITMAYAAVVLLVPIVVFGASEPVSLLPALATVAVALAFQPFRRKANRLANRLVYGKRATPYELLSEFSGRVGGEYAIEDVLPRMARVLGEGSGAERADVWLRVSGELRRAASWPGQEESGGVLLLDGGAGLPVVPDADLVEPVRHRGELLGALSLRKPRGDPVRPAEEKLLRDLASQAGLVLRNVRLTAELEARLRELQESRQRLVTAQDEERRRIERNLHDGAQQQLVALAVRLRLLKAVAAKAPAKAEELVDELQGETQDALENLRDLARGIYPPLLADRGLAEALETQARKSPVPVTIDPDGVRRYPPELEATAYFCVLEALQNVAKYAQASRAEVRIAEEDGWLVFSVTDDGRGFDADTVVRGTGLRNMADRLEALGGSLDVRSAPAEGTTVIGRIPVHAPSE